MTVPASRFIPVSSSPADVLTVHGHDEVAAFDRAIDALAGRCGAPLTARWPWAWPALHAARAHATGVLVMGDDGSLAAAALLTRANDDGTLTVTSATGGDGHRAALLAVDETAAAHLADAIMSALVRMDGPVRLRLGPMSADDPTLHRLLTLLPSAACTTAEIIPVVRRNGSADVDDYLSDGMRRTLRKSHNRLRTDGLTTRFHVTRQREEILTRLPDVADVTRRRDHAGGRASLLDDETGLSRWASRIAALAAMGDVELCTLFIDDEPAAYVIGAEDRTTYRLIEGRFVMEFGRYSPGRLLEADVLRRVLLSPHLDTLDWMTSIAPDRLLCANDGDEVVTLDAVF